MKLHLNATYATNLVITKEIVRNLKDTTTSTELKRKKEEMDNLYSKYNIANGAEEKDLSTLETAKKVTDTVTEENLQKDQHQ